MTCTCEFDQDRNDSKRSWHFRRTCLHCGGEWMALHCPHDGYQNPCPICGRVPDVVPDD